MALGNIALDLLGQARVLSPLHRLQSTAPAAARTTTPCSATSASGATSTSSSRSAATSPTRWPGCCGSRPTRSSCTRPWPARATTSSRASRARRSRRCATTSTTPRLGRAPRRRHRRVPPAHAGRARARAALPRRALRRRRGVACRRRGSVPACCPRRLHDAVVGRVARVVERGHPDPARRTRRGARGAAAPASTRARWATSSPRCSTSPARIPARRGDRRVAARTVDARLLTPQRLAIAASPTPRCRSSASPTSASCATSRSTSRRTPSP